MRMEGGCVMPANAAAIHTTSRSKPPRILGWALTFSAVALIGAGAVGQFMVAHSSNRPNQPTALPAYALLFLTFAIVGALIVTRYSTHAIGWLLYGFGLLYAAVSAARTYAWYTLIEQPGSLVGGEVAAWVEMWLGGGIVIAWLTVLFLIFPSGHLPSGRWRLLSWLLGVAVLLDFCARLTPGPIPNLELGVSVNNPFGIVGADPILDAMRDAGLLLMIGTLVGSLISLIQRLGSATRDERQQLKWLACSGICVFMAFLIAPVLWSQPSSASDTLWAVVFAFAAGTIPAAIGIAILRHGLYDIDLILNRALVYGSLTAIVVGLYALVVGGLSVLLQAQYSFANSLLATGLIAVLFHPLRERLQQSVNRLLYGERDDPYSVLTRLTRRLEETVAAEELLPAIVGMVKEALKVPYAAIELPQGGSLTVVAATGVPVADPVRLPLAYGTDSVGELLVAPRAAGEVFGARDRRLLEDLARQIGVVVHTVCLTVDLQVAREHLVTAREEERRRLRRDLHDGIGAQLAALSIQAGVLHKLISQDPSSAKVAAIEMQSELRAGVADIRRLVHGLRPPALDDLGLVTALRQRVAQYAIGDHFTETVGTSTASKSLEAVVEAPPTLPDLPAAVEVAVYRIVEEALTNVVRHASARRVVIRLTIEDDLELMIVDDGVGIMPGQPKGVGLTSMRERALELGGTFAFDAPSSGGTRLRVRLPLPVKE